MITSSSLMTDNLDGEIPTFPVQKNIAPVLSCDLMLLNNAITESPRTIRSKPLRLEVWNQCSLEIT